MNIKDKRENDDNRIDQIAKQIFGYDDETLLYEFESAEREADEELAAGPELALNADTTWAALMARVQERNLQPVYQADYELRVEKERAREKVIRLKSFMRPVVAVAALMVFMLAMTVIVQGNLAYLLTSRDAGKGGAKNTFNSSDEIMISKNLDDMYKSIGEELGIKVVQLEYLPKGMKFESYSIYNDTALIEFKYNDNMIRFKQSKSLMPVSYSANMDLTYSSVVYNKVFKQDVTVSRNILDDKKIEYRGELIMKDVRYSIYGIMDEEEFTKILESLKYFD